MTDDRLKGRVVVITGGSAGVGRASARAFAARGARVALLARGRGRLDAAVRELEALGVRALGISTDVADADAVEAAAEAIERALGPIDCWVNNAMVSVFAPIDEIDAREFRRVTEVTYLGVVHGTLAALRRMRARDRGTIIQVGSALAYRSIPLQSAYCAAKHAVAGFTESLRVELLHDGSAIHVTMIQMPALNTPQFEWSRARLPRRAQPVPPIFQPEVAAAAIVWSATHRRRELVVGLPSVTAIWGEKFVAGLLDRYLARVGYRSQQTDEPAAPGRPDNLFEAVEGDEIAAHGRFDARARRRCPQLWWTTHRGVIAAGALGLAAVALSLGLAL